MRLRWARQHGDLEPGFVCGGDRDAHGRIVRGAISAGHWRGADFSGKCEGGWVLVSAAGAEPRHGDVRFGGEICAGDRSSGDWSFSPSFRMAIGVLRRPASSVLFYFALFYIFYRNPSEDPKLSTAEREFIARGGAQPEDRVRAAKGAPLGYLLRQPKVWGLVLGFASYNYTFYLLLAWLPSYVSSALHVDLLHSVLYTGVPWLFAGMIDLCIGGLLVDSLIQHGWNSVRVRQAVLIGGTALGLGIFGATQNLSPLAAVFWISVSIGGLSAASPVGWSIPSLIAPRESVGTLGGILNFGNQIAGIAAPIVTGYIVHETHSFSWAFGVAAGFLVIGIAGYLFLLGRMEAIPEPG